MVSNGAKIEDQNNLSDKHNPIFLLQIFIFYFGFHKIELHNEHCLMYKKEDREIRTYRQTFFLELALTIYCVSTVENRNFSTRIYDPLFPSLLVQNSA